VNELQKLVRSVATGNFVLATILEIHKLGYVAAIAVSLTVSIAAAQETPAVDQERELPPAGFGTLGQDDIGIRLRTSYFVISFIPLNEGVIRLLAPDTYHSLHRLLESKANEIADAARLNGIVEPAVFLVSFFGTQTRSRFEAEALTITGQNRLFRPRAFVPLSPSFGDRQVNLRETATAIYIYDGSFRLLEPFTLGYDGVSTNEWERILRTLDRERAAVAARAAAASRDTTFSSPAPAP
jgi:hypothetical protein